MKITVLPKDLNLNPETGIQLYNYKRTHDIQKTKINLSKNTISLGSMLKWVENGI